MTQVRQNGGVSFWWADVGIPPRRDPLPGSIDADVCIVGAGFTGLWAAYHLKRGRPDLDVVVLEREFAGFGASGRNGGWLTDRFATSSAQIEREHGFEAAAALRRALAQSVDDVIAVCQEEGIDADIERGGTLLVARCEAQAERLHAAWVEEQRWTSGARGEGEVELGPAEVRDRVNISAARLGLWKPIGARVHPAKLVRGLSLAAERRGVRIFEGTTVTAIRPGQAITELGTVSSAVVLDCLEGFRRALDGERRTRLPLNSAMVVTEPLSPSAWDEIGWRRAELLGSAAHVYTYAQRTADGRIALGGRGVPYRFGSRIDDRGRTQQETVRSLAAALHDQFPSLAEVPLEQAWCGVLGVARDWTPAVAFDRSAGLASAGGYVGNGLGTAQLAGRTLADLVLGNDTELTRLPWVNHVARAWEPEPLRWLGVRLVYGLYRLADRDERGRRQTTSPFAHLAGLIAGR